MKRIGALVLAMTFLVQLGGYYMYVALQEIQLQKSFWENREKYKSEDLTILKLSTADFYKSKVDDHELRIDGNMYDIVRIEKVDDCITVYAWLDSFEGELMSLLQGLFDDADHESQHGELPTSVNQLFTVSFILPKDLVVAPLLNTRAFVDNYNKTFISFIDELETPPPLV